MRCFLLLLLIVLSPLPALAEEVQGIRIETQGAAGADARETAVALATRQAATKAWAAMGRTDPLPELSPADLQDIATYVDVTDETVRSNYYAATFNIGINRQALARVGHGTAAVDDGAVFSVTGGPGEVTRAPLEQPASSAMPEWVLVVPVHQVGDSLSLWNNRDVWTSAWMMLPPTPGLFMATAGGDTRDREILSAEAMTTTVDMGGPLLQLAQKYKAPAVALVNLRTRKKDFQAGEEVSISVELYSALTGGPLTTDGSLFVTDDTLPTISESAVREGQRLIQQLLSPQAAPVAQAPVFDTPPAPGVGRPSTYTTVSAPPVGDNWQKLWVRMPLKGPADLSNYRQQIESIPNTRFEVLALTRGYVEANIVYGGDEATLMRELAARGLKAQN